MRLVRSLLPVVLLGLAVCAALAQAPGTTAPHNRAANRGSATPASGTTAAKPAASSGAAATAPQAPGSSLVQGTRAGAAVHRAAPCWEVAGLSEATMRQRGAISMQTRQSVQAVCADASLSAAQKQERIHEIRQQERGQIDALMTPEQRDAMRACQQQRAGHPAAAGAREGGASMGNPCDLPAAPGKPAHPAAGSLTAPKNN